MLSKSDIKELKDLLFPKFESIEKRLDKLEVRMDKLEERMNKLEDRMDKLEERIDLLEDKVNYLTESVFDLRTITNQMGINMKEGFKNIEIRSFNSEEKIEKINLNLKTVGKVLISDGDMS